MRAVELAADSNGVSYAQLMQNAGRGLAEIVHLLGQENGWDEVIGLVGKGNNGGDTIVALTWLAEAGWRTHAYLVERDTNDELALRYLAVGGEIIEYSNDQVFDELSACMENSDIFLDGLLGTGIKLPLRDTASKVLFEINEIFSALDLSPLVMAVDCPSGVDCDTGDVADVAIPADLTVTMSAVKQGLLKLPAYEYVGELEVVDIGLPENLTEWDAVQTESADWEMVSNVLPERTSGSHKGTFGTAFIIAGSASYTGAALLAGKAAYRIGAGLVTMAIPETLHPALAGHIPEATWVRIPDEDGFISKSAVKGILDNLYRATACLIGPGLGDKDTTGDFVEMLLPSLNLPLVIDADGLRHLSKLNNWHEKMSVPVVLTPHPGEMSILTGMSKGEIQQDRHEVALRYAKEWGHIVVLKGAFTVIASPVGRSTIIPVATPALARAGTGDVLAGIIVGLLAQGLDAYNAAVAGAFIHAQAGLLAAENLGTTASVLASDVLDSVPAVLAEFE